MTDFDPASFVSVAVSFTPANWSVAQQVTVTGVDDDVVDGDQPNTNVTTSTSADPVYDGIAAADVSVTNTDNDASSITVSPSSSW